MQAYNLILLLGAGIVLFATSNAIWNVVAPNAPRNSDVRLSYMPRLCVLLAGVVTLMVGVTLLVKTMGRS